MEKTLVFSKRSVGICTHAMSETTRRNRQMILPEQGDNRERQRRNREAPKALKAR